MIQGATRWIYPTIIVVLLLIIAALAYEFIVVGSTERGEDARVAVILEPAERTLVLREMRDFVAGVQQIADALSRDDMQDVARVARAAGTAKMHDAPVAMMGKLPLGFKTLALGVHRGFDGMAADAEGIGMPKHSLAQLSAILQKCVACHAAYQLRTPTQK